MAAQGVVAAPGDDDWSRYGRDAGGARYSPLAQIAPRNVTGLRQAWIYHMRPATEAPAAGGAVAGADGASSRSNAGFIGSEATPIVIAGVMYLPTPYGRVVALDAATGRERWAYALPNRDQASTRGVAYWPGGAGVGARIVFGTRSGLLIALDAATGQPAAGFGENGVVRLKTPDVMNGLTVAPYGMTSPPAIFQDLIIAGSRVQEMPTRGAAGDVRAFDARTGKLVWTFHTIPQAGQKGADTWEPGSADKRSGTNVWTFVQVDEKSGIAYLPIGAPTFDRWGGDRKGANLYSNSVVAVDARTGMYLWHFQTVHHDIWDVDLPVLTLIDVRKGGRTIPALVAMNKTAIMFILDRLTGKPIYDVREVPVPTETDVPGEQPWPTQPMPVTPPPLTRLSWEPGDIVDATPELKARCEAVAKELNVSASKMFQPLRADSAVNFFPGSLGGVDWGGGAFDARQGIYVVNVNELASPQQLAQQPDGTWGMKAGYAYFLDRETGFPCHRPPWGSLVGVDVNKGKIVWKRPLGDTGIPALKDAGLISAGGPITTASGLTFIGGTKDKRLRAFETRTGKLLWEAELPGPVSATPMTYAAGGRQMVAAVATGGASFAPTTSDAVVAYALPSGGRGR
ncbi:PQQ-binding-like beta-propeller repeat protein [Sphingomonas quercus]|uniref:PQQ-binding-like beta-propeller repeat protein n=1 Tax=Sphingomonas quercus TaxID=2842451 RepID=A0ABS6BIA7_9SPHN|nr:PQQ-binding-like beta-propeller repeat protein [Sphingomonas quercus]MBU3077546.1 PQQ-binding-like beta-propeller repeat protein [Sphingomonas quercus]